MKKAGLSVSTLLFAMVFAAVAYAASARYQVPGLFHFDYPGDQWKVQTGIENELDWLVLTDENVQDPNDAKVNFHAKVFQAEIPLDSLIDNYIAKVKGLGYATFISRDKFTTDEGDEGYKLAWQLNDGEFASQYFFAARDNNKIEIGGTSPFDERGKYEPIFDGFAKSMIIQSFSAQ